jgi:hypothetical protein
VRTQTFHGKLLLIVLRLLQLSEFRRPGCDSIVSSLMSEHWRQCEVCKTKGPRTAQVYSKSNFGPLSLAIECGLIF